MPPNLPPIASGTVQTSGTLYSEGTEGFSSCLGAMLNVVVVLRKNKKKYIYISGGGGDLC